MPARCALSKGLIRLLCAQRGAGTSLGYRMSAGWPACKRAGLAQRTGLGPLEAVCSGACRGLMLQPVSRCSAVSPVHVPLQRGAYRQQRHEAMLWARSCNPRTIYDPWRVLRRLQMPQQPQGLRGKRQGGPQRISSLHTLRPWKAPLLPQQGFCGCFCRC